MELCKSRTEKSSPDMFNIYVVLAGHDVVTDIAGLSCAGANSKAQHYKQKVHKMKDLPKKWFQRKNSLKISDNEKNRNIVLDLFKKTQWNTRPLNAPIEDGPSNQEGIN